MNVTAKMIITNLEVSFFDGLTSCEGIEEVCQEFIRRSR